MNTALFYDTETTDLPNYGAPSEDPSQPHLCQLAAALVDLDTRKTISSIDLLIQPDGWVIPNETAAIHGITTEHATRYGVPELAAVTMLMMLWNGATRIGHNQGFDARIIRIAQHRFPDMFSADDLANWKDGPAACTQLLATPIIKLPPTPKMRAAGRFHPKSATLGEAYQHFMGKPLEGAHGAMTDVQACIAVYFAIQDHKAALTQRAA